MRFRLQNKLYFPWLFATACVGIFALSFVFDVEKRTERFFALLAALVALTGLSYTQQFQGLQTFKELFREFNGRYDALNERLNEIRDRPLGEPLNLGRDTKGRTDVDVLSDYFNLCAEEYLYAAAGYIDDRVWRAWLFGMQYFAEDPEIGGRWKQELKTQGGSYYRFPWSELVKNDKLTQRT